MKKSTKYRIIFLLIIVLPIVFVLEEAARSIIYFATDLHPKTYEYHDATYYTEGKYVSLKGGKKAKEFFPAYDQLESPLYVDFFYQDNSSCETYFLNCGTSLCVGIQYDPNVYLKEKEKYFQDGTSFGQSCYYLGGMFDSRLIQRKRTLWGQYVYYLVVCSDTTNSLIYIVAYDDKKHNDTESLDAATLFAMNEDFWTYFFPYQFD